MRADQAALPIQFQKAGEEIYLQIVKWIDYTVTVISGSSPYLPSSIRTALVLMGLNIVFFEVSIVICHIVDKLFNCFRPYQDLSENGKAARCYTLGIVFVLTTGGANHLFRKILRISMPVWKIAVLGVLTDLVWLYWVRS